MPEIEVCELCEKPLLWIEWNSAVAVAVCDDNTCLRFRNPQGTRESKIRLEEERIEGEDAERRERDAKKARKQREEEEATYDRATRRQAKRRAKLLGI